METALSTAKVAMLREGDLAHYRTPPHNNEAEQALLGAILINNTAYGRVAEFLMPEHFANAVHGRMPSIATGETFRTCATTRTRIRSKATSLFSNAACMAFFNM